MQEATGQSMPSNVCHLTYALEKNKPIGDMLRVAWLACEKGRRHRDVATENDSMNKLVRIMSLSRCRAREGHLGLWRQLGEMALLRALHGVGPGYYHTAGFWRRELAWSDKTSQVSASEYRRRVGLLNPTSYRKLSQNKIPEKAILTLFGLPTPRFLGRLHARAGWDHTGRPLRNAADLERLVGEQQAVRMVFKQLEGWGGKGVLIPEIKHESTVTLSDPGQSNPCSVRAYSTDVLELGRGGDWIVEEYFEQHPDLRTINPTSVNTVRIWVIDRGKEGYQVLAAYLRIGRGNMFVDNASSGGIVAPVDLATGRLRAARDAHAEHNVYPRHPDHDASIEGVALPYWPGVQALAAKALSVFPGLRFAGLDVAIGPSGPVILELNVSPDREGAAFTDCPSSKLLRVD